MFPKDVGQSNIAEVRLTLSDVFRSYAGHIVWHTLQGTKRALAHSQMRVGDALGEYPSGCTGPYYRVPKTGQKRVRCVSKERSDWSLAVYLS